MFVMHDHTGEKYSREVRIITADFSKGLEIYPNLGEQLKDLDIGILGECNRVQNRNCYISPYSLIYWFITIFTVNNVGITTTYPEYVDQIDSEVWYNI